MPVEPGNPPPAGDGIAGRSTGPGIFDGASDLVHELRGVAHDYLTLAALETKRAGLSLVVMIAAGVMMAILLVSAWLGIVAAGVVGMIAAGMAAWAALLIAVVANIVVAAALYGLIRYKRRYLAYPATLRNLAPRRAAETPQAEGLH
ncbi:MAG TPA: phage holin family protein [Gammaproteobacteria bacterium]